MFTNQYKLFNMLTRLYKNIPSNIILQKMNYLYFFYISDNIINSMQINVALLTRYFNNIKYFLINERLLYVGDYMLIILYPRPKLLNLLFFKV